MIHKFEKIRLSMCGLPLGGKCLWRWWYIQGFPVGLRTLNWERNLYSFPKCHWSRNTLAKVQNASTRSVFSGNWQCGININPNPSGCLFVVEKYVVNKTKVVGERGCGYHLWYLTGINSSSAWRTTTRWPWGITRSIVKSPIWWCTNYPCTLFSLTRCISSFVSHIQVYLCWTSRSLKTKSSMDLCAVYMYIYAYLNL